MARAATVPRSATTTPERTFDAWFQRHAPELRSYARRLVGDAVVAEDIVQETFARAWLRFDELAAREEVGPWLYRVARNLCMDEHRGRRRLVVSDDPTLDGARLRAGDEGDPERRLELDEEHGLVREAFGTLRARHRDVLYLRDIQGMSYEDLASRHGLSEESARAVIARARRRLRDHLRSAGAGIFGLLPALRLRTDQFIRQVGERASSLEPLTAAITQYAVAAAAVAGLALGPAAAPAGSPSSSAVPSSPSPVAAVVSPEVSNPFPVPTAAPRPGSGARDRASTEPEGAGEGTGSEDRGVRIEAGPDEGLPENPHDDDGGNWFEVGEVYPENIVPAAGATAEDACGLASSTCGTKLS